MSTKPATILGLAIGDALGMPFEFCDATIIAESEWDEDFIPGDFGGEFDLKPGQWTDDTKMATALATSLLECKKFDIDNVSKKYIEWVESRDVRGIGIQTERAIHNMIRGVPPIEAGKKESGRAKPSFKRISKEVFSNDLHGHGDFCGNGTVMRCAPIGVFYNHINDVEDLLNAARDDATMTHNHPDARDSSVFLCCTIGHLLNGMPPKNSYEILIDSDYEYDHVTRLNREAYEMAQNKETTYIDAISLGIAGTAHETLASALYCFWRYPSFKEAVSSAVRMGGDTDTRAAIVGALAGSYYGIEGIPKEWIDQVEESEMLQKLDSDLF